MKNNLKELKTNKYTGPSDDLLQVKDLIRKIKKGFKDYEDENKPHFKVRRTENFNEFKIIIEFEQLYTDQFDDTFDYIKETVNDAILSIKDCSLSSEIDYAIDEENAFASDSTDDVSVIFTVSFDSGENIAQIVKSCHKAVVDWLKANCHEEYLERAIHQIDRWIMDSNGEEYNSVDMKNMHTYRDEEEYFVSLRTNNISSSTVHKKYLKGETDFDSLVNSCRSMGDEPQFGLAMCYKAVMETLEYDNVSSGQYSVYIINPTVNAMPA